MRAMVLAAGLGMRMRPLTQLVAKPALPVLNRPLIEWTLEALAAAGVRDVKVNLHHLPGTVERVVGNGARFGLRVSYSREREILGTGGGPRRARSFFGAGPTLLVNGDMAFGIDLSQLIERHRASGACATLALRSNPEPERYGSIVTTRSGRVKALVNRPAAARGMESMFAGIHVIDPAILEGLPPGPSDTVRDLYPKLISAGRLVQGVRVRGAWHDLSTPRLYLASQRALLGSGALGPRGARLVDGDAQVDRSARLAESVVGSGSRVRARATIERSVIWEGVEVGEGARVTDSILTSGVRVRPGERVADRVLMGSGRGRRAQRIGG